MELVARNVNEAFAKGVEFFLMSDDPVAVNPRGKPTLECSEPVTTRYEFPTERVLFDPDRDCNPFLHMFESIWLLAGRDDVKFVKAVAPIFANYSDDGLTMQGSYGYRWRHHFGYDQIVKLIHVLKTEPDSRRAVLTMWSGHDLADKFYSTDIPCNTQVYFKLRDGTLRMTVTNRSNDMIWGAYGANAVQFSMLHEYMADKVGARVGAYTQVSDSFHIYTDSESAEGKVWHRVANAAVKRREPARRCPYARGTVRPAPLAAGGNAWDRDLEMFFKNFDEYGVRPITMKNFTTPWWRAVLVPMWNTWIARKDGRENDFLDSIMATDWHLACKEWLERRNKE